VGKSTLLAQYAHRLGQGQFYYLNFEDERFLGFSAENANDLFQILVELFGERRIFLIDEIQNIPKAPVSLFSIDPDSIPSLVRELIERVGLGGGWVRIDSQVKYAAVAAGLAEIYIRPRSREDWRERIWDHAAGAAIVEGAGGRVTDLDGELLDFTAGPTLENNRGVLVTNGAVHDVVLGALTSD